jgi:Arc/MetJ family transcription regulator
MDDIHIGGEMRTTIELDDTLVYDAMQATGLASTQAVVTEALCRLVAAARKSKAIEDMRGLGWDADIAAQPQPE